MVMIVSEVNGIIDRQILAGMMFNSTVLGKIASEWKEKMFTGFAGDIVGKMCVDYWEKYSEAPKENIENEFHSWQQKQHDEATVGLIRYLMESIFQEYYSEEQEKTNPDSLLEVAKNYFDGVRLKKLIEDIQRNLDQGQIAKANETVQNFSPIKVGKKAPIDLFLDKAEIRRAFSHPSESIVEYNDGLGDFFGPHLGKSCFVAFCGREKSGKSWALLDIAWRAMVQRKKVAFFEVGDQKYYQIEKRFMARAAKHPYMSKGNQWPYDVRFPTSINSSMLPEFKIFTYDEPLDPCAAEIACEEVMRRTVKSKDSYFKIMYYDSGEASVNTIRTEIMNMKADRFIPDVVVIDYADLLMLSKSSKMEQRDKINECWSKLRGISTEFDCLLVTATQANRIGYNSDYIDMENISEDKRKLAHATGIVGISNAKSTDSKYQMCRYNWVALREGESDVRQVCHVARCLAISNPSVCSVFNRNEYAPKVSSESKNGKTKKPIDK